MQPSPQNSPMTLVSRFLTSSLSESHHHLTPSNVTSKLTTLPGRNILTPSNYPQIWFNFLTSVEYITLTFTTPVVLLLQ